MSAPSRRNEPLIHRGRQQERQPRTWYESFLALKKYKEKYGDCLVPVYYKQDTALGHWVQNQRKLANTLDGNQVSLLNSIDFAWSGHHGRLKRAFQEKYALLKQHYEAHGQCEHPKLKSFIKSIRKQYWAGELDPEKVEQLDVISFPWGSSTKRTKHQQKSVAVQAKTIHEIKKERLEKQRGLHKELSTTHNQSTDQQAGDSSASMHSGKPPTPIMNAEEEAFFGSSLEAATAAAIKSGAARGRRETKRKRSVDIGAGEAMFATSTSLVEENKPHADSEATVDPVLQKCAQEWEAELEEGAFI